MILHNITKIVKISRFKTQQENLVPTYFGMFFVLSSMSNIFIFLPLFNAFEPIYLLIDRSDRKIQIRNQRRKIIRIQNTATYRMPNEYCPTVYSLANIKMEKTSGTFCTTWAAEKHVDDALVSVLDGVVKNGLAYIHVPCRIPAIYLGINSLHVI